MSPLSAAARTEWSKRLGRALVSEGYVEEAALDTLVAEATNTGRPFGAVVISRGIVAPAIVVNTLAQLAQLPVIDLASEPPSPDVANLLPVPVAQEHQALPVRVVGTKVVLAFSEPPEPTDVQSLGESIGYEVVPALGDPIIIAEFLGLGAPIGGAAPGPAAIVDPLISLPDLDTMAAGISSAVAPGISSGGPAGIPSVPPSNGAPPGLDLGGPGGAGPGGAVPGAPPAPERQRRPEAPAAPEAASSAPKGSRALGTNEIPLHVDDLLRYAVSIGASDLHLTADIPPTVRLHGALRPMEDVGSLDNNSLREMIFGILPQTQRERFEAEHELDTSHTIAGVGRFRVNVALQRGTIAVALRPIPHEIPEFDTLGLPESIRAFTDLRRGLVLVTGPTGSGKSTSLASLIDIINRTKPLHLVTVEDPIEFLHQHKRSVISQREVGADTGSFSEALRRVLRQDPDVILVGELRDLETISTALTAAETGHLVFATLHTQDAPSTIDRIIDVFPPGQQDQIRIQLGSSLEGVVTQQLVPTADGEGRCVAAEVLVATSAIKNLIRGAKTHQIYSLMQTGGQYGMQTMDQALAILCRQGTITQGMAMDRCRSEEDFRNHLHGG